MHSRKQSEKGQQMVQTKVTGDAVRRTLRTAVAVTVAVAAAVPLLVEYGIIDPAGAPWLASIVAVAAGVTRLMADPRVDQLLGRVFGAWVTRTGAVVDEQPSGKHRDALPPDPPA